MKQVETVFSQVDQCISVLVRLLAINFHFSTTYLLLKGLINLIVALEIKLLSNSNRK